MIFFPFVAAQLFSTRGSIPLVTISYLLRRRQRLAKRAGKPMPPGRDVNITIPFLALTLLAAGVHPAEDRSFFWGLSVLLAWTLWSQRSRRFGLTVWIGAVVAAMALGYASQFGIGQLQRLLEQFNPGWFPSQPRPASRSRDRPAASDSCAPPVSRLVCLQFRTTRVRVDPCGVRGSAFTCE
jgi:hypothetical protein